MGDLTKAGIEQSIRTISTACDQYEINMNRARIMRNFEDAHDYGNEMMQCQGRIMLLKEQLNRYSHKPEVFQLQEKIAKAVGRVISEEDLVALATAMFDPDIQFQMGVFASNIHYDMEK